MHAKGILIPLLHCPKPPHGLQFNKVCVVLHLCLCLFGLDYMAGVPDISLLPNFLPIPYVTPPNSFLKTYLRRRVLGWLWMVVQIPLAIAIY